MIAFLEKCGTIIAVSKEKYTKEKAIEVAKFELSCEEGEKIYLTDAWVRYRYGRDDDGNCSSTWWLEFEQYKRSCPVYAFIRDNYYLDRYEEIIL